MLLRHISRRQIASNAGAEASSSDLDPLEEEVHELERRQTVLYDVDAAKAKFLQRFPEYGYGRAAGGAGRRIDDLYAAEIAPRLGSEHYLDFTGSGLYFNSQIAGLAQELGQTAYGNPHSVTPSSVRASREVEGVRKRLMALFGADPAEYELVFTRSATGALQLIGEMFPWSGASQYAIPAQQPQERAGGGDGAANGSGGTAANGSSNGGGQPAFSLFAYPAYDNFSGKMNPAEWVKAVQAKSTPGHQWKVIWDTAAYAPCHPINLAEVPADFICLSFYKLFGYPTGVGALIMRRDMAARMRKVFWGGGSANFTVSSLDWSLLSTGPERFEDGTLPFIEIMALKYGLRVFDTLGGPAAIEAHVESVGRYLYEQASQLRHSNGTPLLEIYGNHARPDSAKRQGSTLTFSLLDPSGQYLSWRAAAHAMMDAGLHVRSGGMCNPGELCSSTGMSEGEMMKLVEQKMRGGVPPPWEWALVTRPTPGGGTEQRRLPMGALRASCGHMSRCVGASPLAGCTRFEDVAALIHFLSATYTDAVAKVVTAPEDVVEPQPPGVDAFSADVVRGMASC
ncbi:hypothetical protein COHA_007698 [Chlorella ohadii]|uniref:Aminotransferase class V domain-containing protein n=1 Tax=Chlorella ohadii TaxID=2649997 RepID=A0AAD5DI54_9CHLO|nr:hypothetical protein COHA_007698 [Chlorella ohadii]